MPSITATINHTCSSFLPSARHFQPQRLDLQMIILPTRSKLTLTYREKQRAVTFFTQRCKCKRMWKLVVFLCHLLFTTFSPHPSSLFSSPPPRHHLQSLHTSLLFVLQPFTLSLVPLMCQNKPRMHCRGVVKGIYHFPNTSLPASWTHFITSSMFYSQSVSWFHSLRSLA